MSGLAVLIRWDGRPVEAAEIRRMLAPVRRRGPDGTAVWVDGTQGVGVGMGHALLATTIANRERQPVHSPDSSCVIVADVALYNRPELVDRLGRPSWLPGEPSDAALLLAAYERGGERFLDWLEGDYAFVIWDPKRRLALAARDHFGTRTLCYREHGSCLALASEAKQLTETGLASKEPDEIAVAEFLLFDFRSRDRTFFREIKTIPQGHFIAARCAGLSRQRYWRLDPASAGPPPGEEAAAFFETFRQAVQRRLQPDYPVVAQLSGGFDSSSIVAMAGALSREGAKLAPRIETCSWVYPSFSFDEAPYRGAILDRYPFANHLLECTAEPLWPAVQSRFRETDSPFAPIEDAVLRLQSRLLAESRARVLVMGLGGDEVLWDPGLVADLGARGRYSLLWGESSSIGEFLRAATPRPVKRSLRRVWPVRSPRRLPWVGADSASAVGAEQPEPAPPGASHLQRDLWAGPIAGALFRYWQGFQQGLASSDGVEVRFPFLDRRLVELLWSIPAERRVRRRVVKRLLREAMHGLLPDIYRARAACGDLAPYPPDVLAASWEGLSGQGLGSLCVSRGVDTGAAAIALKCARVRPPRDFLAAHGLWRLISTSLWMRTVLES